MMMMMRGGLFGGRALGAGPAWRLARGFAVAREETQTRVISVVKAFDKVAPRPLLFCFFLLVSFFCFYFFLFFFFFFFFFPCLLDGSAW